MTREEALRQFEQEHQEKLKVHRKRFMEAIPQNIPMLLTQITGAFAEAAKKAELMNKEKLVYFHFSLLRCDMIGRNYHMLLQVQDIRWFLDPEPIEVVFSVNFFYQDLNVVWDTLLEERRKYIGKINTYDVDFMIAEEAAACNLLLGDILRYSFRDIEENSDFAAIPKELLWDIRWGEYRGTSVLAARVDRIPQTSEQWKASLRKEEGGLSEMYWYQTELTESDCSNKEMCFTTFEECLLKNLNFKGADLTGARFIRCRIEGCDFDTAILNTTYFEGCYWRDTDLKTAIFKQTVCTLEGIPLEGLDDVQLNEILVKEG